MDTLIPIAINRDTGEWTEVSEANRGTACNCICPSCGQGLIARQGEINAWHFAHDNASEHPDKDCELSFYSCCRTYLIDLFKKGLIPGLKTPEHVLRVTSDPFGREIIEHPVTDSRTLTDWAINLNSGYDLALQFGGHELYIHCQYPGRGACTIPQDGPNGLLTIDLVAIKSRFYTETWHRRPLKEFLIEHLSQETEGKEWAYHPRQSQVQSHLNAAMKQQEAREYGKELAEAERLHSLLHAAPSSLQEERAANYICIICRRQWTGTAQCPNCHTNLYSRRTDK